MEMTTRKKESCIMTRSSLSSPSPPSPSQSSSSLSSSAASSPSPLQSSTSSMWSFSSISVSPASSEAAPNTAAQNSSMSRKSVLRTSPSTKHSSSSPEEFSLPVKPLHFQPPPPPPPSSSSTSSSFWPSSNSTSLPSLLSYGQHRPTKSTSYSSRPTTNTIFSKLTSYNIMLLFIFCCCVQYSYADVITLQPLPGKAPSISDKEAVLIILPEKGVPHTDYKIFGRLIQQLYPLRLWIELVEVAPGKALSLENLPLIVTETNRRLESLGNIQKSPDVFLAAHGHYGHLAADYAKAMPGSLRGLILLGAFLPKRMTVASFPLPVLTVAGEVDGVTRITRIAEALGRMMSDASFEPSLVSQSPLVVLEGCNHDVYISGQLPVHMYQMDIESDRDRADAMETAATVTSLFLVHTLLEPYEIVKEAEEVFKDAFERAKLLTKPIRDVREMTQDTNFKSYWVKAAQKWLSGLEGKESSYLEVDSYVVDEAGTLALPPALVIEEGIPYVVTFSDVVTSAKDPHHHDDMMHSDDVMAASMMEEEDAGISPQAPVEIAARMLGPERIQKFLQNTTIAKNYTCRDLNYCSFMTAYHSASPSARERYDRYHRGIVFEPDVITDSEALWESTKLKIEVQEDTIHVTSIAYRTPQDESLTQYSGLFFCKLLPPDRALEWIYVDSLRRDLPTEL